MSSGPRGTDVLRGPARRRLNVIRQFSRHVAPESKEKNCRHSGERSSAVHRKRNRTSRPGARVELQ